MTATSTSPASSHAHANTPLPWIDLGGTWTRAVAGTVIDVVAVPGSYAPVGVCLLSRTFMAPSLPATGERLYLVTDGVLSLATFRLNGVEIGIAGPWVGYRFELPAGLLRMGENRIEAEVQDLTQAFGPVPGRRFDGGLVRPIFIERRAATWLSGLQFSAGLSADCSVAEPVISIDCDGPGRVHAEITLMDPEGQVVARGTAAPGQPLRLRLARPRLWSPERPELYTLSAQLPGIADEKIAERVGFRRIDSRGSDLYLNNERLVLAGVCRHEFTHAWGYSPPAAVVRRELARIKHAGFNYIRLVHAPQAAMVCRLAAEIGLLVSEEPGTCWQDLGNETIAAPAVECLRRTVARDRNVPSILAWFIYNECNPHVGYATRIAEMVRAIDPECRLGMADCSGDDAKIMEMVATAGLTFYGINVYHHTRKAYIDRMRVLKDHPLIITEWSGFLGMGNDRLLRDLCALFARHVREDESLRVAGGSIWVWADYEEHSRPSPASIDGWTVEGLVRADGTPKADLLTVSQMAFDMLHQTLPAAVAVQVVCPAPLRAEPWRAVDLGPAGNGQEALEARMDKLRRVRDADNWLTVPGDHDGYAFTPPWPRLGRLMVDGLDMHLRDASGPAYPLLLGPERPRVVIPVGARVAAIAVLGQVMVGGGYPAPPTGAWAAGDDGRALGTPAARLRFCYSDGTEVEQPLRHGFEILRHNDICRWWTPAPRSATTRPAVRAVIDTRYETMRLDLWERPLPAGELREVVWELVDSEALLLIAAISVLGAGPG